MMPNHYSNMLLVEPGETTDGDLDHINADRVKAWCADGVLSHDAWGTKWDIYDVEYKGDVAGDQWESIITFASAWSPPNEAARQVIVGDLRKRLNCRRVIWLGINPYDGSFHMLGTYEFDTSMHGPKS